MSPQLNIYMMPVALLILIVSASVAAGGETPFAGMHEEAKKDSPLYKATGKRAYGEELLQPYFVCDNKNETGLPLSAWHYSCSQACSSKYARAEINVSRLSWSYVGDEVPTYKVITNEVCYTAHENMWGYCSQSQTTKQVTTTLNDKGKIPKEFFKKESHLEGVKTLVNSGPAECEYFSDNTKCARDYVVTYRPGKLTKKADTEPLLLNIYGDGIRTNPFSGHLIQNEAAWFWDPVAADAETKCGWGYAGDMTCHFTETSDIMICPTIGYQYNIKELKSTPVCGGIDAFDIHGPVPFQYRSKGPLRTKEELAMDAIPGKSTPDVNLIQGINAVLDNLEVTYCSSSCDLFARDRYQDDDAVVETPIGYWRLNGTTSGDPHMMPCTPTSTWRLKSPTMICHGKNHLLVEDSKTLHTCSWDTTKNYIVLEDLCSSSNQEAEEDLKLWRGNITSNREIGITFWTGDKIVMKPPYTTPIWQKGARSIKSSPSWFSKVTLDPSMIHSSDDISSMITTLAENTKREVLYNATGTRSIRTLLFDEVAGGLEGLGNTIKEGLLSLMGGIPKFLIILVACLLFLWFLKTILFTWALKKISSGMAPITKSVSFEDPMDDDIVYSPIRAPSNRPSKRSRSRSRAMGALADSLDL